ncbi:DUF2470 domain-containing protein [Frankia nepalensis]|uniref:DUF2470 domain-containing protein n=1 Tax=Frankia nepalensis TaxID=1836974 RepID=A0A937URH1_9ACTN|nr:DUF2470 domain-containing protein [Frankia nepalensis]MBL7495360.1 DUF2470 domain-containing protein [Frankia nepalensis]MBL7514482.1 DUF2470 domain-containing protein [Frankia nepalensis]MBL7627751.1 DUF2470 domain-containing protein [Frankia nepalensis]
MFAEEPDDAMLAVRARTVLAGARHALLTLPGARVQGWTGLIDDGGEPVLLVGAGSPPTHAAAMVGTRGCRLDVPGTAGERLVLTGRLRTVPGSALQVARRLAGPGLTVEVPECADAELAAVALSVEGVLLCLPSTAEPGPRRGRSRRVRRLGTAAAAGPEPADGELGRAGEPRWPSAAGGRRVDLAAYALAEPDLIAAYAPDLIEHLNVAHAGQLRQLARHGVPVEPSSTEPAQARVSGSAQPAGPDLDPLASRANTDERAATRLGDPTDPTLVVGVAVGELDRLGLTLWQVGTDGADELRVTFTNPLTEPRSLGLELRRLLHGTA